MELLTWIKEYIKNKIGFFEYLLEKKDPYYSWWTVIICRWKGHPEGVWYYNSTGYEPDMHCKNCGDDLG